jgi:phosphopantetheinyl transferase
VITVYVRRIPQGEKRPYDAEHQTAWALLADVVQREYGKALCDLPLAYTEHGKPYFTDSFVHFSLSHTKALAVLAIGDAPCGVDAEAQSRHISAAVRARFLPDLPPDAPSEVAVAAWTAREAYGKMTGEGLLTAQVSVPADVQLQSLFAYRHIITVCAQGTEIAKDIISF